MTLIESWTEFNTASWDPPSLMFSVNECMTAEIRRRRLLEAEMDYKLVVAEVVAPLIWHAMPGHEGPRGS